MVTANKRSTNTVYKIPVLSKLPSIVETSSVVEPVVTGSGFGSRKWENKILKPIYIINTLLKSKGR